MVEVTEIMDMIDWHMPPEIQAKGISLAKDYRNNYSVYTTVNAKT